MPSKPPKHNPLSRSTNRHRKVVIKRLTSGDYSRPRRSDNSDFVVKTDGDSSSTLQCHLKSLVIEVCNVLFGGQDKLLSPSNVLVKTALYREKGAYEGREGYNGVIDTSIKYNVPVEHLIDFESSDKDAKVFILTKVADLLGKRCNDSVVTQLLGDKKIIARLQLIFSEKADRWPRSYVSIPNANPPLLSLLLDGDVLNRKEGDLASLRPERSQVPAEILKTCVESYEGTLDSINLCAAGRQLVLSLRAGGKQISCSYPNISREKVEELFGQTMLFEGYSSYRANGGLPDHFEIFRHTPIRSSTWTGQWREAFKGLSASDWDSLDR